MTDALPAARGAVVVGGSRGIGRAVAELLAANGAGVVVNGRDPDAVDEAVGAIAGSGGRAIGLAGAAHIEANAVALMQACREEYGSVDVLINCAGVAEPAGSSILTVSTAQFHDLIDAHLGTVFQTCRAAAPIMVEQRRGSIVNSGSVAFLGDYGGTGYPAGKGAINALTVAIAAELSEYGVRANVVCPGAKTRLSTGSDYEAHIRDLHARGLLDDVSMAASLNPAPAEYVAALYAYLAGDLAAGVTGAVFLASGGFVGRFDRQIPAVLGYRDHQSAAPWSIDELHAMVTKS
ncbi:SDR family NAD(P)-dependent oxidoreductase [[Mycobacterium] kokjensenii]|uniref:SDR family NAD(P)-dependent oxidoreductase n=1 Tax=[Mycobacterium] kokjensenii TaxID=3064287 RepID=A0ABM9LSP9_9MYCO|nr:SDR family NAD(P)-dependent oxidoreductase [Mycolicibacter sp. MU0083]CAJ1504029.1 SDR family NAD(P)-dependent oxidoreductase [Mycolicibacter sp. MU0083]